MALDFNESLKSQKLLLDNSYQNFLIQKGIIFASLSLSGTWARSSNLDANQNTDSCNISLNSSYTLFDFGSLKAEIHLLFE